MYRFRMLDRYKRYYYHALRNDKSSEHAADEAMTRTKKEMREIMENDHSLDEYSKREMWGDTLAHLMEWQSLLNDVCPTASKSELAARVVELDRKEENIKRISETVNDSLGVRSGDSPSNGISDCSPGERSI